MATHPRLFLIDGMAIAYRSYFAFIQRPLMNSKGENTSAVYGFATFLNKILDEEKPEYIAVAMDTSAPTFRHKSFKEYKATRQKMPEDMASQLGVLKDLVRAYGVPVIELDGFEADDIMGTLAKRAEKEAVETYLVTSDKDFMQLVSDMTKIYKPGRQGNEVEIVGFEGVREKFGVHPDNVIDVLGLIGDKSDNVPGVPGVGEKTAIPLIQQYGSIENLYEHLQEIPQKGLREKLTTNKEKAFLSKKLVTIEIEAPVEVDFHRLKMEEQDTPRLLQLLDDLEFRALAKRIREGSEEQEVPPPQKATTLTNIRTDKHSYHLAKTEKDLFSFLALLSKCNSFVFDTETTSTDPLRAQIVGFSFAMKEREAFYIPFRIEQNSGDTDLFGQTTRVSSSIKGEGFSAREVLPRLKAILENPDVRKIGQNLKYDMLVLSRYDIGTRGVDFDTMVAGYLIREDGQHNLDALAREYLDYETVSYDDLTGTGRSRKDLIDVPVESVGEYSCEDADITLRLEAVLRKRLDNLAMSRLAHAIEFPLISVLARMESTGVAIDTEFLSGMSKELERTLDNLTKDIYRHADETFNINSTQQLGEILFKKLKLPPARKTKTGFSTDVAVLETLRGAHPVIDLLLEYRQLTKLKSTYVDALPQLVHPSTGRVHTSFNQTVASTGRLSSSDPNLQNIPIRTEIGRSIRQAFIPGSKNNLILSADYSQIELRMMAHICGDESLREAFAKGEDIHATTAAKVFGVDPKDVSRDMRRKAKEVNFGIMYGIGPFGLSRRLEISQSEGKEIIDRYFERFPKVKQYIHDTIEQARNAGYVSTLLGRRRYLPDIKSRNQNIRSNAERQAINMPIQGTSADMIKVAMVNIDHEIESKNLGSRMILQVHDELVFDIVKKEEEQVRTIVSTLMKKALELSVPIEVEIGVGKNWLEAH